LEIFGIWERIFLKIFTYSGSRIYLLVQIYFTNSIFLFHHSKQGSNTVIDSGIIVCTMILYIIIYSGIVNFSICSNSGNAFLGHHIE